MFCCGSSLATTSVATTPKCCRPLFLKLSTCFRCGNADDDQDGHDNGHDIHFKCVLACCGGTVADNDIADRTNREECYTTQEKQNERKLSEDTNQEIE